MTLGTSDWVTIIATAVSIVSSAAVSIGVAIWQVKKALNSQSASESAERVFSSSTKAWLLAQVWPFIVSAALALFLLIQALMSEGVVTRSFVISLVFGSMLLAFSILSSLGFVVAAAFRPFYLALQKLPSSAKVQAPSSET